MKILGIETSCDETSVAVIEGRNDKFIIIENIVSSQIKLHQKTGGVVPEVAARAHLEKLLPIIKQCSKKAKFDFKTGRGIDAITIASGPGLITALLVGVETAKTLSYIWNKPIVAVNHMAAHIYSSLLPINNIQPKWIFPVLALVVSGGHTELVLIKKHCQLKKIGATLDDAAGEAFDKVAKILNLPYPGGPEIEKLALFGNAKKIDLPRPLINSKDYNFSFSGLKTAVLYKFQNIFQSNKSQNNQNVQGSRSKVQDVSFKIQDVCASFQQAVVDVLTAKTLRAAKEYNIKTVCLVGGVAANTHLRNSLKNKISEMENPPQFLVPEKKYCVDNAAMVGVAGIYHARFQKITSRLRSRKNNNWEKIEADSNWEL